MWVLSYTVESVDGWHKNGDYETTKTLYGTKEALEKYMGEEYNSIIECKLVEIDETKDIVYVSEHTVNRYDG